MNRSIIEKNRNQESKSMIYRILPYAQVFGGIGAFAAFLVASNLFITQSEYYQKQEGMQNENLKVQQRTIEAQADVVKNQQGYYKNQIELLEQELRINKELVLAQKDTFNIQKGNFEQQAALTKQRFMPIITYKEEIEEIMGEDCRVVNIYNNGYSIHKCNLSSYPFILFWSEDDQCSYFCPIVYPFSGIFGDITGDSSGLICSINLGGNRFGSLEKAIYKEYTGIPIETASSLFHLTNSFYSDKMILLQERAKNIGLRPIHFGELIQVKYLDTFNELHFVYFVCSIDQLLVSQGGGEPPHSERSAAGVRQLPEEIIPDIVKVEDFWKGQRGLVLSSESSRYMSIEKETIDDQVKDTLQLIHDNRENVKIMPDKFLGPMERKGNLYFLP